MNLFARQGRTLLSAAAMLAVGLVASGCPKAVHKAASWADHGIAELRDDGMFIIGGAGPMDDYEDDHNDRAGNICFLGLGVDGSGDEEEIMMNDDNYDKTHRPWRYHIHDIVNATVGDSVTRIGKNTFDGCLDLRTVAIGKGTASIGPAAFRECVNLTAVIIFNPVPPALEHDSFDKVDKSAVCLYVPAAGVAAYASAKYWADFKCVKTVDTLSKAALYKMLYNTPDTLPVTYGALADARDGKTYKTVKMPDGKTWMAENLNYDTADGIGSWCYEDSAYYCGEYGRIYDWNTAMAVCPAEYHLPSRQEWEALVNAAGGVMLAGKRLKAVSAWHSNRTLKDNYGFSALPGGYRYDNGRFNNVADYTAWWTSTENAGGDGAFNRGVSSAEHKASENDDDKSYGYYVRCVYDAAPSPTPKPAEDR